MKRLLIILAIIPLLFSSCHKDPYADFIASANFAEIGEMIYFTNRSMDADSYEWDFGDGNYSFNFNANHSWIESGRYSVSLKAFRDDKIDIAIMTIEIAEPPNPISNFSINKTLFEVGEEAILTNLSANAYSYSWDFGDGFYSSAPNPRHSWSTPGFYDVYLTATGVDGSVDIVYTPIQVKYISFTNLEITVEEFEEPYYLVSDISVRLYPSVSDWEEETNMIAEGYTNENGVVSFTSVAIPYNRRLYVDVWGPFHDNYTLAGEDVGWIETDVLTPNVWNYFTAVVDYFPDGKKATIERKDLKEMKKQESVGKPARIPTERENLNKGIQTTR